MKEKIYWCVYKKRIIPTPIQCKQYARHEQAMQINRDWKDIDGSECEKIQKEMCNEMNCYGCPNVIKFKSAASFLNWGNGEGMQKKREWTIGKVAEAKLLNIKSCLFIEEN